MQMQSAKVRKASRDSLSLPHSLRTTATAWNDQRGDPDQRLGAVKNESRCFWTEEIHELSLEPCCPVSGNPLAGSMIAIKYEPCALILEVKSLRAYVDSYQGGRGDVRSMEGMIQAIAQDCADTLGTCVTVNADLVIEPGQKMKLKCIAFNQ